MSAEIAQFVQDTLHYLSLLKKYYFYLLTKFVNIKPGLIEKEYAKIAKSAFSVRTQSDYSDFYVVSKADVIEQYENAVIFVSRIEKFINSINI